MNGGVVIKAEVKYSDAWRHKTQMVGNLSELTRKTRSRIPGAAENFNSLKQEDIKILGSLGDKEAVLWIWCQSQGALNYAKTAYESNLLRDAFIVDTKDPPLFTNSMPNISIDMDHLRKEVAEKAMTLEIEENIESLKKYMKPHFKVLNILHSNGSLTRKEIDTIHAQKTHSMKNSKLLECILTKSKCSQLIEALKETNQQDIVTSLINRDPKCIIKTAASMTKEKPIKGVALLNNEIFIVSQTESVVEVFSATTFVLIRWWELKELTKPHDATACVRNKCLYIVNGEKEEHEILKVDSMGKLIKKWSTHTTGNESGRLSVTKESNVLFAVYDTSTLKEFSAEGELIHLTELTNLGVIHPWHALKLRDGIFLVSHGSKDDRVNRLCEVDARPNSKSQVTKIFGAARGTDDMELNNPTCLATDQNGMILVADSGNGRVILLDSNFKFKRKLLSKKDGLAVPTKIILDEVNGNLIVGNYKGNLSLLVFGHSA